MRHDAPFSKSAVGRKSRRFSEGEQSVQIVLVLLATALEFGREANGQVVYKRVELVEDSDDTLLFFEWRDGKSDQFEDIGIELRLPRLD